MLLDGNCMLHEIELIRIKYLRQDHDSKNDKNNSAPTVFTHI